MVLWMEENASFFGWAGLRFVMPGHNDQSPIVKEGEKWESEKSKKFLATIATSRKTSLMIDS